ncbi:hypothetical protein MKW94_020887 [Papaver nudicaule]|uniref:pectinesterase n=1 Tax=Papaver nudicaule TaxID=74823 RepID=A0AA41UVE2_PAPNU|nr:hypothetical protein [Papaver nudicaule]
MAQNNVHTSSSSTSCKFLIVLLFLHSNLLLLIPGVVSVKVTPFPSDPAALSTWESSNILPFSARANDPELDPAIKEAEKSPVTIRVRKDGSGQFKTVTEAVNSIPEQNKKRAIIVIGPGTYVEKIKVPRSKPFVTFYGEKASDMPKLTFNGDAAKYGTVDSSSVITESDYFMAVNIVFENSSPPPDGKRKNAQAVAIRVSGTKSSFFNCKFYGYQDTICDDRGLHFFKDCFIEGTEDFLFGSGTSLYLKTTLHSVAKDKAGVITAQAREKEDDTGYVFVHATIQGSGAGNTVLGRAWKPYAKTIFVYSSMDDSVKPEGWDNHRDVKNEKTVYFAEYQCTGPGASKTGRVKFAKMLTEQEAKPYLDMEYIKGSTWIVAPPAVNTLSAAI